MDIEFRDHNTDGLIKYLQLLKNFYKGVPVHPDIAEERTSY